MFRKGKNDGAASVGDQRTVLIVDDDVDSREALALVVETEGYQAFQAENGQQALDWIEAVPPPPGLILLDLGNAGDGRARISVAFSRPAVHCHARGYRNNRSHPGRIAGAMLVLRKPVAITELLGLMQKLMPLPERMNGVVQEGH